VTQHFPAGFAAIAGVAWSRTSRMLLPPCAMPIRQIRYGSALGEMAPEFEEIPHAKRSQPYRPRVAVPFERSNLP
jgi:hypothetical protein